MQCNSKPLLFTPFSWQDGNPEYLSDLDRQVMQKQRLRQVKNINSYQNPEVNLIFHILAFPRPRR